MEIKSSCTGEAEMAASCNCNRVQLSTVHLCLAPVKALLPWSVVPDNPSHCDVSHDTSRCLFADSYHRQFLQAGQSQAQCIEVPNIRSTCARWVWEGITPSHTGFGIIPGNFFETETSVTLRPPIPDKSSSGDEIPERDVTYLLSVYLPLNYDTPVLPEYFLSKAYLSHI